MELKFFHAVDVTAANIFWFVFISIAIRWVESVRQGLRIIDLSAEIFYSSPRMLGHFILGRYDSSDHEFCFW